MSLQKVIGSDALSALASDIKASIALKADQSDTYTKEEVDDKIAGNLPEKSASGAIATFETNYAGKLKSLSTTIVAKGGGGTPSTPIPIVGYSEVNLTRCGKNFLPSTYKTTTSNNIRYYWNATGGGLLLKANVTYCISVTQGSTHPAAIYVQDYNSGTELTHVYSQRSVTYTPTTDVRVRFDVYYANSDLPTEPLSDINCQVELGSTATAYEPYNGQTITLSLGQTVYGGVLDVKNGSLTVNYGMSKLGVLDFTPSTPENHIFRTDGIRNVIKPPLNNSESTKALCESFVPMAFTPISSSNDGYFAVNDVGRTVFIDHQCNTVESFLSNHSETILIYPLATPFTIDLSSSDMLDAVVGINNVFSDCGNTELEYYYKVTELASLDDVNVNNPVNGQVLKYDSASDKWINATGGGSTPWTDVTGTLTAGQTSITLSDPAITTSSTLDYYTDTFGVNPTSVSVANGSVTLTFEAQASNLGVKVRVS